MNRFVHLSAFLENMLGIAEKKKFALSKTREKIEILTDAIFQSLIKWSSDRDFVPEAEQ